MNDFPEVSLDSSVESRGVIPEESAGEINFTDGSEILSTLWERCKKILEQQLDPQVFIAYIMPLKPLSFDAHSREFALGAPSRFLSTHIEGNYKQAICRAICLAANRTDDVGLKFVVGGENDPEIRVEPYVVVKRFRTTPERSSTSSNPFTRGNNKNHNKIGGVDAALGSAANPRYTFSNFVVGNNSQFCHAAALRVAELPGASYNPLFIYGGVGLGKTHLLHAIGNYVTLHHPLKKVIYMSSETFTNELILALRNAKMDEFKNRLRNVDLLLVDDIQFMAGKERTQEEFFHTFNALYNSKHQIVVTCDKIATDIPGIEDRLKTRFSWGLIADLQAPDFETRVAILNRKAGLDKFDLPVEVAHYIAKNVSSNVRELEGAFTRLSAYCSLQKEKVSLEICERALKAMFQPRSINISISDIRKAVSNHFSIKVSEMVSKRRTRNLSFPRHIAMYLCRKHATHSYPDIGEHFGGRDHSSVIHAAHVVSGKLSSDDKVKSIVQKIERELLGGNG